MNLPIIFFLFRTLCHTFLSLLNAQQRKCSTEEEKLSNKLPNYTIKSTQQYKKKYSFSMIIILTLYHYTYAFVQSICFTQFLSLFSVVWFQLLTSRMLINKPKRASPGIEPGPPAPHAGILPLNYKASTTSFNIWLSCYVKKGFAGNRTRASRTLNGNFTT